MSPGHPVPGGYSYAPPRRRSRWLWWVYLGCGMFSCIGFIVVAVKVQSRKFVWGAVISVAACAAAFASYGIWTPPDDFGDAGTEQGADLGSTPISIWIIIGVWIGLVVYGHVLDSSYRKFLRDEDDENHLRWHSTRAQTHGFYAPQSPHGVPRPAYGPNPTADPRAAAAPQVDPLRAEADRFLAIQPLGNAPAQTPPSAPG